MIDVPTAPWLHPVFDLAAWSAAALGGRWVYRRRRDAIDGLARQTAPGYFVALAIGAVAGAWLSGSLNSLRFAAPTLSHSIAGALAGGIAGVELWKWRAGVRQSTGGAFVIPLCAGIVVGRWGCLFAGLADETYGLPAALPWAVNLGDGMGRHPVQIYESLAMAGFLAIYWRSLVRGRGWAVRHGFHAFILAYAVQRFAWEFLKPYPPLVGPLNLFHLLMIGLAAYAVTWIARTGAGPSRDLAVGTAGRAIYLPRADDEPVRDVSGAGPHQDPPRG